MWEELLYAIVFLLPIACTMSITSVGLHKVFGYVKENRLWITYTMFYGVSMLLLDSVGIIFSDGNYFVLILAFILIIAVQVMFFYPKYYKYKSKKRFIVFISAVIITNTAIFVIMFFGFVLLSFVLPE